MKRVLFIFALFLLFCIASCDRSKGSRTGAIYSEYEDTSLAKVIVKGSLVVGIMDHAPPCAYIDSNGQTVGFDVDIFKEVAERLDIDVEFKVINWGNKEQILESGGIDCIASAFTFSKDRQLDYALTMPTLYNAQVVVVRNNSNIYELSDLGNRKIGYLNSSNISQIFEEDRKLDADFEQVLPYSSFLVALGDLKLHAVDAVFIDLLIINNIMEKNVSEYRVLKDAVTSEKYVYAFRKNDKLLRNVVNRIMLDLEYEGKVLEFSKKWFGSDIYLFGR
ncbi:MAG: transporter substrate-binding domain-containing protein [Treponema sp.]